MKVLHININDYMGAGLCCYRISKSLQKIGVDSKILVVNKRSNDNTIFSVGKIQALCSRAESKFLGGLPFNISEKGYLYKKGRQNKTIYTLPVSNINLSKHFLVEDADIIHLHWVDGLIDYPSFFENVDKPIVWTLHDEGLFYGVAHYEKDVFHNDIEEKYCKIKNNAVSKIRDLGIVFLSKYFYEKYKSHAIIRTAKKCIIHNSVDTMKFKNVDKEKARKELGLDKDSIYFSFIAYDITEKRKGLKTLINAVKSLDDTRLKILAVGKNDAFSGDKDVIEMGCINDSSYMSKILSASDYFVMPSTQEAFAQTPLEAMACGIPVIAFPVSGTEELITPNNGIICNGFTENDLVEGIKMARNKVYDPIEIRKDIERRFSPISIAQSYVSFYNEVLKK